jgi:hypothetical protein
MFTSLAGKKYQNNLSMFLYPESFPIHHNMRVVRVASILEAGIFNS